jgi:hypothetical protein
MRLARMVVAAALLFGAGCTLPEEGDHQVDPASLDDSIGDESAAIAYEDQVIDYAIDDEATMPSGDSAEAALAGDEGLLGKDDYWVCWSCVRDKDKGGGDKCPKEYCYHGKHKKKDKAKDKAEDACEEVHGHDCKPKECKKFD